MNASIKRSRRAANRDREIEHHNIFVVSITIKLKRAKARQKKEMKFSFQAWLSLTLMIVVVGVDGTASTGSELPPNHPPTMQMHPTLAKFSSQLRCPYAQEWLTKGAHKAAIDLGLTSSSSSSSSKDKIDDSHNDANAFKHQNENLNNRRRVLQEAEAEGTIVVMGSCSFNNQWTGETCMQFRGEGLWTADSMLERCNVEPNSSWSKEDCPTPSADQAGWCVKVVAGGTDNNNAIEATSMMITAMSDCSGNKMACETFIGGIFEYSSGCSASASASASEIEGSASTTDYSSMIPPTTDGDNNSCMIAPGKFHFCFDSFRFTISISRSLDVLP